MKKKAIIEKIDLQQLYDQDLFNRHYLYKNVNYKFGIKHDFKLFLGFLVLVFKFFLSRFSSSSYSKGTSIFISLGPLHIKRSKDLSETFDLIEYNRASFSKVQLHHFQHISVKEIYACLSGITKSKIEELKEPSLYATDNFFYRFLFIMEFLALKGIIKNSEKVFMAGYNDRASLIISKLCEVNDIHLSMLQHGVLGKKEYWMHLKADRFFYLYPFSKNYIKYQISVLPSTELIYLPKKNTPFDFKTFKLGKFSKNVAYATSPADSDKDVEILKELIITLQEKQYNLLIYPHPLEKENLYKQFEEDEKVFVTRERHGNIAYLFSRYSTLGIDYYEKGITPIFLNYENHKMDFLESDSFKAFKDPLIFKKWTRQNL